MAEQLFRVRHGSLPPIAEGVAEQGIVNRMGMQVVIDFFTQLALSGKTFHVQAGTEDAGFTATAAIDDELASILIDQNTGYAMIPLRYEVSPGVVAGATLAMAKLELDMAKKRYSSGGTAFVPQNLNNQSAAAGWAGAAYVAGASDIVALAKSAVPLSVELAHRDFIEDALANTIGYPGAWEKDVYNVRQHPMAVAHGATSLVGHLGSATADMTAYARIQVAQLETAQLAI